MVFIVLRGLFLMAALNLSSVAMADQLIPEIAKSPGDPRQYQSFELANGLRVLLVSDPKAAKAAAALDVNIGSGSDPDERPGLAHFLEHMLFLGTEGYPVPGEFKAFVSAHGGKYNAYTTYLHTQYFFDIDSNYLQPALDRFAQFFTEPLLLESHIERERHAVDAEYRSKLNDDRWRKLQAFKQTINPRHPFSKFFIGSRRTLADSDQAARDSSALRSQLKHFFEYNYSAHLMTLVVLGAEPIEQLRHWVKDRFTALRRTPAQPLDSSEPLFTAGRLPAWLELTPLKDERELHFTFPIPEPAIYYRSKPLRYIAYLITHEGKNSLYANLKREALITELSARRNLRAGDQSTFEISLRLTEAGFARPERVAGYVFQYLNLLRAKGITRWLFEEQRRQADIAFRFREAKQALREVMLLASNLRNYPMADLLRGPYLMDRYEPDVIADFLAKMTPGNVLLTVSGPGLETDRVTERFDTPYRVRPVSPQTLRSWQEAMDDQGLRIPNPNPFMPDDLTVLPMRQHSDKPERLTARDGFVLWHKQDTEFRLPYADFYVSVRTPVVNATPRTAVLSELLVELVNDQLSEFHHAARLAGLHFTLYKHLRGLSLKVSGYSNKQEQLLARLLTALRTADFSNERFLQLKEQLQRKLSNSLKRRSYKRVLSELNDLLIRGRWSAHQQLQSLLPIEQQEFSEFVEQMFTQVEVVSLAHGNIGQTEALSLGRRVEATFASVGSAAGPENRTRADLDALSRVVRLPLAGDALRQLDSAVDDSALAVYFQSARTSFAARAQFQLLGQILKTPFLQALRTEQKLGYVVFAAPLSLLQTPGIVFVVQSPTTDALTLAQHVERFLAAFDERLEQMSDAQLDDHKRGLLANILSQDNNIKERSERYWKEVNNEYFNFDSHAQLAAAVRALDKDQLIAAFRQLLQADARRRLTVFSLGKKHSGSVVALPEDKLIKDVQAFKQALNPAG